MLAGYAEENGGDVRHGPFGGFRSLVYNNSASTIDNEF